MGSYGRARNEKGIQDVQNNRKGEVIKLQVITLYLTDETIQSIDDLIEGDFFVSQTEFMREAIRMYLTKAIKNKIEFFSKLPNRKRAGAFHKMKNVTLNVPQVFIDAIDKFRDKKHIETRSIFIRDAITAFINDIDELNGELNKFLGRKAIANENKTVCVDGNTYQIQSISEYMKLRRESALLQRNA